MEEQKKKNSKFSIAIDLLVTPFRRTTTMMYFLGMSAFWFALMIGFWGQAPVLLPSPSAVFSQLINFLGDSTFYVEIISSVWLTIKAMMLSIIIASLLSYLSVTMLFRPLVNFLIKIRYMSLMGFIFTFTLLLHNGGTVKIALLIYGIVPFLTLSLTSVIQRIRENEYDLWTTLRFNRWEQLFQIVIYGKADYLIEAIRTNFAMAWLMITLVESFSMADGGLGVMLFRFNKYNQLDNIFALQIVIFILGVGFDYLLQQLRYMLFPHTKLAEKK